MLMIRFSLGFFRACSFFTSSSAHSSTLGIRSLTSLALSLSIIPRSLSPISRPLMNAFLPSLRNLRHSFTKIALVLANTMSPGSTVWWYFFRVEVVTNPSGLSWWASKSGTYFWASATMAFPHLRVKVSSSVWTPASVFPNLSIMLGIELASAPANP